MIDIRERINKWLTSVGYVEGKSGSTAAIYPEDRVSLTTAVEAMVIEACAIENDRWQEIVRLNHQRLAALQEQVANLQAYKDIAQSLTTDEWMVVTARVEAKRKAAHASTVGTVLDAMQKLGDDPDVHGSVVVKGWKP